MCVCVVRKGESPVRRPVCTSAPQMATELLRERVAIDGLRSSLSSCAHSTPMHHGMALWRYTLQSYSAVKLFCIQ
jgi:hypothetical protein